MTPTSDTDEVRSTWLARAAAGVSICVHVIAVALSLGYAGAGLFASEPEAVPVEVVSEETVAAEPTPEQENEEKPVDLSKLDLRPALENSRSQQPQASQNVPQAAPTAPTQQAPPKQVSPQAAYTPPPPDISLRYQIDLGLKPLSIASAPQVEPVRDGNSNFDEAASSKAEIGQSSIAAFRAHLKECAPLPAAVGPDDKVVIVLRATFTPDAKLAATPILIEASASAKGPALMQAAIAALQSCQPYNDLPADKYAEWRVLDLRFTPQDFRRG